jgi:hypothetical protein
MKLISFSLWGANPKYLTGAIRNAELLETIYPDWRMRFYCGSSVPTGVVAQLQGFSNVEVVPMPEPGDWRALFWRFYPASDSDVSVVLSRDADSRISVRESAAVDAWLRGDRDFHVMRDHPWHDLPIQGGMWGVRNGLLRNMRQLIDAFPKSDRWQTDQEFLTLVIAPIVRDQWLEHDEYYAKKPFPVAGIDGQFVGQQFDEVDHPLILRPSQFRALVLRTLRSVRRHMSNASARLRSPQRLRVSMGQEQDRAQRIRG